ncbi:MAG: YbaK/EbsC family protein [Maritimibacter sp.]
MSKSLKRVRAALDAAGLEVEILEMLDGTRTAQDAARAAGCEIDQIVKSILVSDPQDRVILFLTAGGNQVDMRKASAVAGCELRKADAKQVRAQTGFAIGGVAPIGHVTPPRSFMDPRLRDFAQIWGAAGTPRHIFAADPRDIERITGAQIADFTT